MLDYSLFSNFEKIDVPLEVKLYNGKGLLALSNTRYSLRH